MIGLIDYYLGVLILSTKQIRYIYAALEYGYLLKIT